MKRSSTSGGQASTAPCSLLRDGIRFGVVFAMVFAALLSSPGQLRAEKAIARALPTPTQSEAPRDSALRPPGVVANEIQVSTPPRVVRPGYGTMPEALARLYDDAPTIELVTMGVGARDWERHGHIALCVRYVNPADDECYNYGIGDFENPGKMALGFLRGKKSFWVGKMDPRAMMSIYTRADRSIWIQPLPLTADEKRRVLSKLEFDIREENKHYAYDHFWDNCTTRVRDVLDEATGGKFKALAGVDDPRTYRDLAREGFYGMRPYLIATDLIAGRAIDRRPSYWERMFLPEYMREAAERAWGISPHLFYARRGAPALHDGPSGRIWFALLLIALTSPAWLTRLWGRFERVGLGLALTPMWLFACALWFVVIISPLPYFRWNELCLVLLPTDIVTPFLRPTWRQRYARLRVYMIGTIALLVVVGLFKQPLWATMFWPLIPFLVTGYWPGARKAAASSAS